MLSEPAAHALATSIKLAGFRMGRLKTGTPPRLHRDSINFDGLFRQEGDMPAPRFSYMTDKVANEVCMLADYEDRSETFPAG